MKRTSFLIFTLILTAASTAGARIGVIGDLSSGGKGTTRTRKGVGGVFNWAYSVPGDKRGNQALWGMKQAIDGIERNRHRLPRGAWRTFQIRAAKITGRTEGGNVEPVVVKGKIAGAKVKLASPGSPAKRGSWMSIEACKLRDGYLARLNNGRGVETTLRVTSNRAKMTAKNVASVPFK